MPQTVSLRYYSCCLAIIVLAVGFEHPASIASVAVDIKPSALVASPAIFAKSIQVIAEPESLQRNIQLHLTKRSFNLNAVTSRQQIEEAVRRAAQAVGYYEIEVSIIIDTAAQTLQVSIIPGKPIVWSEPTVSVTPAFGLQTKMGALLKNPSLEINTQLNHQAYDDLKKSLLEACKSDGYLDAFYKTSELRINKTSRLAAAHLELDCGPRYIITQKTFTGSALSKALLETLTTNPVKQKNRADGATSSDGESPTTFNHSIVRQNYRNLSASGYFDSIDISQEKSDNNEVSLTINLKDKPKHQFLTGVGFGTDTGPRAQLQWQRAVLNERGHSLSSALEVSPAIKSLTNNYRLPSPHPLSDFNEYQIGLVHENIENKTTEKFTFGYGWHYKNQHQLYRIFSINLEHERSQVDGESARSDTLLLPQVTWSLERESEIRWLNRYRLWSSVLTGQKFLGASTAFLRLQAGSKWQIPLNKKHQLIARLELGYIKTPDITEVPLSQRFFTGGDQTVRGYDFEEIDGAETEGDLEGGKYLNVASIEYNYFFATQWQIAVFADSGRVFNDTNARLKYSTGVGLRWLSPVGQLRADIARPIDDPNATRFRLHFFLGAEL